MGLALPARAPARVGYSTVVRRLDPDWITEHTLLPRLGVHLRVTSPALTALDLLPQDGGAALHDGFRLGLFDVAGVSALFDSLPPRRGDRIRRELLAASADQPWSPLELDLHRLLRAHGVTGWRANWGVTLRTTGRRVVLDGWVMLRFTAEQIHHEPDRVARQVRLALGQRPETATRWPDHPEEGA